MALTYPRAFPAGIPIQTSRMGPPSVNQAKFISFASQQIQTQTHAGGKADKWTGVWITAPLSPAQQKTMTGWLASLDGEANFFYAYDPDTREAANAPGNALVDGAAQTGTSIDVKGWPLSTTTLLAGERFQIDDQYYIVLEDVVTDGAGKATIEFRPAIRNSPADNTTVITTNPVMIARLVGQSEGANTNENKIGVVSINFEEVI